MDKLNTLKTILQYSASIGTGMVVTRGIKQNIAAPTKTISAFAFKAGTYGISGVAGSMVHTYIGREFDELVAIFREVDKKIKEKS